MGNCNDGGGNGGGKEFDKRDIEHWVNNDGGGNGGGKEFDKRDIEHWVNKHGWDSDSESRKCIIEQDEARRNDKVKMHSAYLIVRYYPISKNREIGIYCSDTLAFIGEKPTDTVLFQAIAPTFEKACDILRNKFGEILK